MVDIEIICKYFVDNISNTAIFLSEERFMAVHANPVHRAVVEHLVRQAVYQRMGKPVPGTGNVPSPLVVNISARHCHLTQ
ncbi:MAG: hypothetical protein ACJ06V_09275, partial [Verrucomicrobiota bacterium]